MDVSIIFVNYKSKDLTINAIKSVIEKTHGLEYEIFVVDNNSQDGSIEAIGKEFPNINIIKSNKNGGFGYANNLAIKNAKGKYILCLNTDTLLVNNAIKIMFDFMEREDNQNVGICGAYLIDGNKQPTICGGNLPSLTDVFWKIGLRHLLPQYYKKYCVTLNSDDKKYTKNIGYITGADIFFRKSVLDKVGIFDEKIFMYYEETDLCKRISDSGYKLALVEKAIIQHFEGKSFKNTLHKRVWVKQSELYYFSKHHPSQILLIKLIYVILYLIDWLILGNKEQKALLDLVINF